MTPSWKKHMRLATSRAKPISCVTTIMVVECASASRFITASTSWMSSGSRADVGSSKSMTSGRIAKGACDRDALLLTTREPNRMLIGLVSQADIIEQLYGALADLARVLALDAQRRLHDVVQHRHLWEEVELLEDHATVGAQLADLSAPPSGR